MTALGLLKELVAAIEAVDGCRFCCLAADEECHKKLFDGALGRARRFLKEERKAAENKPS